MSTIQYGFGVAQVNEVAEIMKISEAYGPITLLVRNFDSVGDDVVILCEKKSDGSRVSLVEETAVAAENTGYTGNASTRVFSAQSLNELPIIPGTVVVTPTAGGNSVNATDLYKDGKLYTDDADLDICGTINYFTGALYLSYPSGKDPNTGGISADYTYSIPIEKGGIVRLSIPFMSAQGNETLIVKASSATNSRIVVEAVLMNK
jgi:hypothetical protein